MLSDLCLYQKLIDSYINLIQYQPKDQFQLNPKKPNPISVNFFFLPSRKRFQKVIAMSSGLLLFRSLILQIQPA